MYQVHIGERTDPRHLSIWTSAKEQNILGSNRACQRAKFEFALSGADHHYLNLSPATHPRSRTDDHIEPLEWPEIARIDDVEASRKTEIARQALIARNRPEYRLVRPVVDHVYLVPRNTTLHKKPFEPWGQYGERARIPVHGVTPDRKESLGDSAGRRGPEHAGFDDRFGPHVSDVVDERHLAERLEHHGRKPHRRGRVIDVGDVSRPDQSRTERCSHKRKTRVVCHP